MGLLHCMYIKRNYKKTIEPLCNDVPSMQQLRSQENSAKIALQQLNRVEKWTSCVSVSNAILIESDKQTDRQTCMRGAVTGFLCASESRSHCQRTPGSPRSPQWWRSGTKGVGYWLACPSSLPSPPYNDSMRASAFVRPVPARPGPAATE